MRRLLLIEDTQTWADELKIVLKELGENAEVESFYKVNDFLNAMESDDFVDGIELALVDLELGPASDRGPQDLLGRDSVLPKMREKAPWIPVILVSRYIYGASTTLAEVSPFGFDAILTKKFFDDQTNYRLQWEQLRLRTSLNRIGSLTGRSVDHLKHLLEKELDLDYGKGVEEQIKGFEKETLFEAVKLMELGSKRLVIDQVVQGFSGLTVMKVTSHPDDKGTSWLVKCGMSPRKLNRELTAHRKMFVDGLTRRLSVPPFWWAPVVWKSFGIIAYEFEKDSEPLLDRINKKGLEKSTGELPRLIKEFYKGSTPHSTVPRKSVEWILKDIEKGPKLKSLGFLVDAIVRKEAVPILDESVRVLKGCQHGDFHTRNIILTGAGPVLIDFAHYRSKDEGGVPLLDLAKLVVDTWAFSTIKMKIGDVISGEIIQSGGFKKISKLFAIRPDKSLDEDEMRLFGVAVQAFIAAYTSYPDVPKKKRDEGTRELLKVKMLKTRKV